MKPLKMNSPVRQGFNQGLVQKAEADEQPSPTGKFLKKNLIWMDDIVAAIARKFA
jgi:hypothetical protein